MCLRSISAIITIITICCGTALHVHKAGDSRQLTTVQTSAAQGRLSLPACSHEPERSTQRPTHEGVTFAQRGSDSLMLDIYLPSCTSPSSNTEQTKLPPAMLYVHPGGWSYENKTLTHPQALRLLSRGIAVVSADYRLVPERDKYGEGVTTTWPAQGEDVADAVRWLKSEGSKYGIDTRHLGCWGESSGGHLCAWLATVGAQTGDTRVDVAVDMFGPPCFLCGSYTQELIGNSPADWLFNFPDGRLHELKKIQSMQSSSNLASVFRKLENYFGKLGQSEPSVQDMADIKLVTSAEPLEWITNQSTPLFIGHGISDGVVPYMKSEWLAGALSKAGVDNYLLGVKDGLHMYKEWSNEEADIDQAVDFVLKYLTPVG